MRIRKEHRLQSRKRKVENTEKNRLNAIHHRRYQKSSELIISSPPYAEKSTSSPDVFFGRWQATKLTTPSSAPSSSIPLKAVAPNHSDYSLTTPDKEDAYYEEYTKRSRHRHHDNRYLSSPDSSLDSQRSTKPYSRQSHRGTPALYRPLSLSPPTLPSLAKYHNYNDKKPTSIRLPTPPVSLTDIHQHAIGSSNWGTRLPPLRAIMNDHNKDNFPLLLPPPPSLYHR